jgi:hypothetical protein
MIRKILPWLAIAPLLASPAHASNTTTLPQGVLVLDESWATSTTDVRWDDARQAQPLITGIKRYEPGGGLQGTITAQPHVEYKLLVSQLQYGVTDYLTLAVAMPVVAEAHIQPHLGWTPGVYQPQMGRQYTEQDFWQWAKSMGQPKPGNFDGNRWTPADMVLGLRWRLPPRWLKDAWGLEAAVTGQAALPTGKSPDPEELVAGGTRVWDLHDYGDAEFHLSVERPFRWQGDVRVRVGLDVYHAWLFERQFQTPRGTRSPLLLTYAPYVGDTFKLDPGDLTGVTGLLQVMPIIGPEWSTFISGHDRAVSRRFPPLLMLWAGLSHVGVAQSQWTSQSAWWDWQREKEWLPGDKHTVRLGAEVSLMRLGIPLNLYATYRNQEWIPGRNTRAANVMMVGARLIMKFW